MWVLCSIKIFLGVADNELNNPNNFDLAILII